MLSTSTSSSGMLLPHPVRTVVRVSLSTATATNTPDTRHYQLFVHTRNPFPSPIQRPAAAVRMQPRTAFSPALMHQPRVWQVCLQCVGYSYNKKASWTTSNVECLTAISTHHHQQQQLLAAKIDGADLEDDAAPVISEVCSTVVMWICDGYREHRAEYAHTRPRHAPSPITANLLGGGAVA